MLAHNKVTFALNIKNVVVPSMDIPTYARESAECKSVYGINVEAIILCKWKHVVQQSWSPYPASKVCYELF
jgi:hypothetical protein